MCNPMPQPVEVGTTGPVRTLTLNRPERLNAVTLPLYETLVAELEQAERDPDVRAVVLTGQGRAFCVGADLKAHGEGLPSLKQRRVYVEAGQRANQAIQRASVPVVAAVNGHAIGAGLELALSCDLIVAAQSAKLRLPEVSLGTFVGGGVTYTLPSRVGMTRARELILLGRFFLGSAAAEWGLVNRSVPTEEVLVLATEWARELAGKAPRSLRHAKRLLARAQEAASDQFLAEEAEALIDCMESQDWSEGVAAFAEGREPVFRDH